MRTFVAEFTKLLSHAWLPGVSCISVFIGIWIVIAIVCVKLGFTTAKKIVFLILIAVVFIVIVQIALLAVIALIQMNQSSDESELTTILISLTASIMSMILSIACLSRRN